MDRMTSKQDKTIKLDRQCRHRIFLW